MTRTLVWYRGKDLRVADHEPLTHAAAGGCVIPLFVLDPYFFAPPRAREIPHRIQFLLESLTALAQNLAHLGTRLLVVEGKSTEVVPELARAWKVDRVVAQRWTEPFARERDRRVAAALAVPFDLFDGETLAPPGSIRTLGGTPYSVFTPFARALRTALGDGAAPRRAPRALPPIPPDVRAPEVAIPGLPALGIVPNPRVLPGGEAAARARLKGFLATRAADYEAARDRLDVAGTSRLSVDLKFGLLSPRAVWRAAEQHAALRGTDSATRASVERFRNELVWREFAYATLWDRPEVLKEPFRKAFVGFPWRDHPGDEDGEDTRASAHLEWTAWAAGRTGYPVVDAAARQLLEEGFVHNRARMIAASFLTKHLMIDYRRGEAHYLRFLTDGDWAPNNLGWQWSAGTGCDAQPYFRIFNPVTQGQRFDPEGHYVRTYVPELSRVPTRHIHAPWAAPPAVLAAAGVTLGSNYPAPIVDHAEARQRYLAVATSYLKR